MEIKRFLADNVREGMLSVRSVLGPDAVILSNRRIGDKIEILATNEFEAESLDVSTAVKKSQVEVTAFGAPAASVGRAQIVGEQPAIPTPTEPVSPLPMTASTLATGGVEVASTAVGPNASKLAQEPGLRGQAVPGHTTEMNTPRQTVAVPQLRQVATLHPMGAAALSDLQNELVGLKSLLVDELAKLKARALDSDDVIQQARIRLSDLGLQPASLDQLMMHFDADQFIACETVCDEWQQLLKLIGTQLQVTDESLLDAGGVFAVIGSTGVGKTTTVAKLAARYALKNGRDSVALITTDAFKMGGQDQLMTLGKLLDLPVQVAVDANQLTEALQQVADKSLVLIDSAGMSERDIQINRRLSEIEIGGRRAQNLLIVSSTSQLGLADEVVKQYAHAPAAAAILTKTDEALNMGSGLATLMKTQLPLAYVCHGQGISDIKTAKISSLLSEAFAMMKASQHTSANLKEGEQRHA